MSGSAREEEIADFIAGLGASRLTILQGMSGTGKTSLPKIVCEALMAAARVPRPSVRARSRSSRLMGDRISRTPSRSTPISIG